MSFFKKVKKVGLTGRKMDIQLTIKKIEFELSLGGLNQSEQLAITNDYIHIQWKRGTHKEISRGIKMSNQAAQSKFDPQTGLTRYTIDCDLRFKNKVAEFRWNK